MSKNKKKKRAHLHVDQLVVKADKVIIVEHEKYEEKDAGTEAQFARDPWGFFPRQRAEEVDKQAEEKADEESDEEEEKRGWSWI